MITVEHMLSFVAKLEKAVQEQDSSFTVRLQQATGALGVQYLVHIENAVSYDTYRVEASNGQWIRQIDMPQ